MNITIGIADDSSLSNRSITALINSFDGFQVILNAINGKDLLDKLGRVDVLPDIVLLDVSMPEMNGIETAERIKEHSEYSCIKLVALSQKEDEATIVKMVKAGCCAYFFKDDNQIGVNLEKALQEVHANGSYNADAINTNSRRLILFEQKNEKLKDTELQFLELACSDRTYKEIAVEMNKSERTVDGYREELFEKLNVKSRAGLVLEAVRRGLVNV